jgi:crossover junction endodeoxyribonuclease RuvC
MNVLALDAATRLGWALMENGHIESGVEDFSPDRHASEGTRWLKFRRWMDFIAGERFTPDLLVYERWVATRTGTAAEVTAGFTTRIREFCTERQIEHQAVSPCDLKRWTTGKGNANKAAMKEAVARRWRRIDDDNEADAFALLQLALDTIVPAALKAR